MSPNARFVVSMLGALFALGGVLLMIFGDGAGWPLLAFAALLFGSLLFEPRYPRERERSASLDADWRRTAERFIDDETGQAMEVWVDPLTGERRYEPISAHGPLSRH